MAEYQESVADGVVGTDTPATYVDNEFPQAENLLYSWTFDSPDGLMESVQGLKLAVLEHGAAFYALPAVGSHAVYIGPPPSDAVGGTSYRAYDNPLAGPNVYGGYDFSDFPVAGRFDLTFNIWAYKSDWSEVGDNTSALEGVMSINGNGVFTTGIMSASADGGVALTFKNKVAIFSLTRQGIQAKNVQTSIASLTPGWHMFTCVYRAGRYMDLYVDKTLGNTTDCGSVLELDYANDGTTMVVFGVMPSSEGAYVSGRTNFIGALDAPNVWESALSSIEVQGLYDSQWLSPVVAASVYALDTSRHGTDYYMVIAEAFYAYGLAASGYGKVVIESFESVTPLISELDGVVSSSYYERAQDTTEFDTLLVTSMTFAGVVLEQALLAGGLTGIVTKTTAALEAFVLASELGSDSAVAAMEVVSMLTTASGAGSTFNVSVLQNISLAGKLMFAWAALAAVSVTTEETMAEEVQRFVALLEQVNTSATPSAQKYADVILAVTAHFVDLMSSGKGATSAETAELSETLTQAIQAYLSVLEGVAVLAVPESTLLIYLPATEQTVLTPVASGIGVLRAAVTEGVTFSVAFTLGGETYTGWVMNTKNFAVTEYQNFPFNSFCKIGSAYLGANSEGLYVLEGADDAGTTIDATFSLGVTDLGSDKLKELDSIYLGFKLNGDMLLKTISEDGVERVYTVTGDTTKLHTKRVHPLAKGLRAMYWQLEMSNVAGVDFELDMVEFMPVVLSRRVR